MEIRITYLTSAGFAKARLSAAMAVNAVGKGESHFYESSWRTITTKIDYANFTVTVENVPDDLPESTINKFVKALSFGQIVVNYSRSYFFSAFYIAIALSINCVASGNFCPVYI